jgi:transcription elongation factor GreA
MPVRDALPSVLRGELGASLDPDARARLESLAHDAQAEKKLESTIKELANRQRDGEAPWGVPYLLAACSALHADLERANQTLLALGQKLVAARAWEPLAAVADRALALVASQAAARMLVQAHEGLARDPDRIDALSRAWAVMPDDLEVGLLLAKRLGEAGRHDDRRALLAELAPGFAEAQRWSDLEDATIELAEADDHEGLVHIAEVLPVVAAAGALKEAASLAGLAAQGLAKSGRAGLALGALRKVVLTATGARGDDAGDPFREAVRLALQQGPGATVPDVEQAAVQAGLTDGATPLPRAIEAFDTIAALAPGRGVLHDGFGPGRILSNDTETVVIDFIKDKGRRMPYAAAKRTLTPVAEDDVRLLRFSDPAQLLRMRTEDHAALVVGALRALGGSADANKLKMFMITSELVPAKDWTTFWLKGIAACEKDPRIDHARAFEQFYRLAPEGAAAEEAGDHAPLPPLEPRKPAKTNLGTIKKFLAQHPTLEKALQGRFGRFVQRVMSDPEGERSDRARAGLHVTRWYPELRQDWLATLRQLWAEGLTISDLATEDEQLALLADSRGAGVEAEAILSALDSRFAAVRDEAERDRAQLDADGRARLRRVLLERCQQYPAAVMRLVEEGVSAVPPPDDMWRLFFAALQLIEERPKPSTAEKVLRWIDEGGEFSRLLPTQRPGEEMRLKLRVLLRQWRSSDRLLFPALDAVERVGFPEEKRWVLEQRQRRAEKLFSSVGEQVEDFDIPVMTRNTWHKLQAEMDTLERELRTTIPQTIQRARELGDLKENAEYHSAKQKQANVQKQVASLQLRLTQARFVEDAEYRDGIAGLGTEVLLVSDEDSISYWILGDGEHHLGENVISHQAAIAKAILGHRVGEAVALGEGDARREWRIESIARKLPPAPESTPAPSSS